MSSRDTSNTILALTPSSELDSDITYKFTVTKTDSTTSRSSSRSMYLLKTSQSLSDFATDYSATQTTGGSTWIDFQIHCVKHKYGVNEQIIVHGPDSDLGYTYNDASEYSYAWFAYVFQSKQIVNESWLSSLNTGNSVLGVSDGMHEEKSQIDSMFFPL